MYVRRAEPRIRLNVVCIPGCAEHGNDGPIEEYHGYKMPFSRDFIQKNENVAEQKGCNVQYNGSARAS